MHAMQTCAPAIVLLAAGEGSRFGGAKQLASIAGEPIVRRVARTLLEVDVPVFVVTGAYADEVEAVLDDLPLNLVRCETWQLGMGHSLAAGVRALRHTFPHTSAVLVCLADQPLLDISLIRSMLQRHQQVPERVLATAQHGTQGPPALFPHDCFDALSALTGITGARAFLQREKHRMELFESPGVGDVDTPEDLERMRKQLTEAAKPPS